MTDRERRIDELAASMTRCAVRYTDITVLAQVLVTVTDELRNSLEDEGRCRHLVKRYVNRASELSVRISSRITDEMRMIDKAFVRSYTALYDRLMEDIDRSVLLTGSEKWLSLLDTVCVMISEKLRYLHRHHHEFTEMECCAGLPKLRDILRDIPGERHDLEPIIRPLLSALVTPEEWEQTKQNCINKLNESLNKRTQQQNTKTQHLNTQQQS